MVDFLFHCHRLIIFFHLLSSKRTGTMGMIGIFSCFFCRLLTFFPNHIFRKILSGIPSECQCNCLSGLMAYFYNLSISKSLTFCSSLFILSHLWHIFLFSDTIYFHLPAREGCHRTVHGVACYRQIDSNVRVFITMGQKYKQVFCISELFPSFRIVSERRVQ